MKKSFALVTGLALLASGCASKNVFEVTVSPCPAIAVVGDVGTVTRFAGEGRDAEDVRYTASITDMKISCVSDVGITSNVTFDLVGRAGPAWEGGSETLYYFVAVMKDNHQIVTKKIYSVDMRFGGAGDRTTISQTIQNRIPSVEQAQKYDYEILVGLQVTPEEAVYTIAR